MSTTTVGTAPTQPGARSAFPLAALAFAWEQLYWNLLGFRA